LNRTNIVTLVYQLYLLRALLKDTKIRLASLTV